jgi:hypothetical protein
MLTAKNRVLCAKDDETTSIVLFGAWDYSPCDAFYKRCALRRTNPVTLTVSVHIAGDAHFRRRNLNSRLGIIAVDTKKNGSCVYGPLYGLLLRHSTCRT